MLSFDKIVNKLLKKWWKVLLKEEIFELIDPEKKSAYQSRVDKCVYRLKIEWVIIPLKSGVYVVPSDEDKQMNTVDLLEKYYLQLLKKYISYHVGSHYFISWKKALQIHMKDFSIPEKMYIVNRSVNKKIKIGNYEIIFKTVSAKQESKPINLYSKLTPYISIKNIDGQSFKVSNLELSLVESALISDAHEWFDMWLLSKVIKKYDHVMDHTTFYTLGTYKFSMSFNRLKEIAKPISPELSQVFLDIIKKNGWLFIGEWLRGF